MGNQVKDKTWCILQYTPWFILHVVYILQPNTQHSEIAILSLEQENDTFTLYGFVFAAKVVTLPSLHLRHSFFTCRGNDRENGTQHSAHEETSERNFK